MAARARGLLAPESRTVNEFPRFGRFVGRMRTTDSAMRPPRRLAPGAPKPTSIELAEPYLRRNSRSSRPLEVERPMPQHMEAERSILGAILLDNNTLNPAIEILKPEDFYHDHHQHIYRQMIALGDSQQAIDLVTLTDQLHRSGKLESSGGAAYIAQLMDGVPHVRNVEHYARLVKEKALLRDLIHETRKIQQMAFEEEVDAASIAKLEAANLTRIAASQAAPGEDYREEFHSFSDFEGSRGLNFAIEGFLQTDAATMIAGLSGHDKTFIMLSITKALLAGKGTKLWGTFEVKEPAICVIYLIPESSIEPFKHRLQLFGLYDYLRPEDGRLLVRTLSKGPTPCLSDPRILFASKASHVFLDTAVRFSTEGDENSAGDNQRGLAADIFALLASGARSVVGAHHAPKSFAKETAMTLENILRGSGDIGAMLATCWGVRQIDRDRNIVYVQNVKPRDFEACGPFQLIGRPYIDSEGDFRMHKRPGESGFLQGELNLGGDHGGAPAELREQRQQRIEMVQTWLDEIPNLTRNDVIVRFGKLGIAVSYDTAKNYLSAARKGRV
jgi:hypothetical protein